MRTPVVEIPQAIVQEVLGQFYYELHGLALIVGRKKFCRKKQSLTEQAFLLWKLGLIAREDWQSAMDEMWKQESEWEKR